MSLIRQLSAIMFADIAGYTALMQEDEKLALDLRRKFQDKLEKEVTACNGRILDFRGDGALCTFTSTIEAVKAALAVQLEMQTDPVVPLRIGMHTGDVLVEGNNIYGDSVNIASRMESFAMPGSIYLSGKAYDDIKNQKDIQAISLGRYLLKNVREEVEIFAISNPGIKIPGEDHPDGKGKKVPEINSMDKSIMVLPFVNLGNDGDEDYFSDGLTEELITKLSKLTEIRVTSRTTSMLYKNTRKDIKTISKENRVNYILEGSIRKYQNDLRIAAQFIDANNDIHLWADTYRGTIDDIFDIQEKVSEKIAEALRIQLSNEERVMLRKRYTENTDAYELYLRGRHFWKERNEGGLQSAVINFEKALQNDSRYALAWSGLADTYSLMGEYTNISRRELFPKQMAAVYKALQIDNRLGEAHISLAISLMLNEWDWENSRKEYLIGLELSPDYATGHHWYAEWLLFMGKKEEAFREISLAVSLDPSSPGILKDKGIFYYYTGQYEKAIDTGMLTMELHPAFVTVFRLLSLAYQGMGMYDESIRQNERWGERTGNVIKTQVSLAQIYASAERRTEALAIVDAIENQQLGGNDYRGMAMVYAALGDNDKAFNWLDRSYQRHEESLCSLKVDPKLNSLHSDPRFSEMLRKIGLDK
jgi:adenylate cyclase